MSTGASSGGAPETSSRRLARLARVARWLDAGIPVPGTSLRFGLDPLIGLIPGGGDAAGAVLAGWIVLEAYRLGASRATLLRMAAHVALDAAVGAVPVLGDIFDFAWKANLRNVALLERHLSAPARAQRADRWFLWVVLCGLCVGAVAALAAGYLLARWMWRAWAAA